MSNTNKILGAKWYDLHYHRAKYGDYMYHQRQKVWCTFYVCIL